MKNISVWISLFTSSGTLICCALPSLFVVLGLGASFAGLVTSYPQITWLSENKNIVFVLSGVMLFFAGLMQYRARNEPCPIDPKQAKACERSRKISIWIYLLSLLVWLTGAFFAFMAPYVFQK